MDTPVPETIPPGRRQPAATAIEAHTNAMPLRKQTLHKDPDRRNGLDKQARKLLGALEKYMVTGRRQRSRARTGAEAAPRGPCGRLHNFADAVTSTDGRPDSRRLVCNRDVRASLRNFWTTP